MSGKIGRSSEQPPATSDIGGCSMRFRELPECKFVAAPIFKPPLTVNVLQVNRVYFWIVIALLVLVLIFVVPRGHAQVGPGQVGLVTQPFVYVGPLANIPAASTCINATLAFITDATAGQQIYECYSKTWTQQTGGGSGSGCIPPGTTASAVLYDAGSGTCSDVTKFTSNGTTTLTGAATAVLDMSAGATFKAPASAGYAPTVSASIGYDSTANKYVFGQNGSTVNFGLAASGACSTHNFVSTDATATAAASCTQPAFSDLSGSATGAQLPNPSASTLGGVESLAAVTHNFLTSISTSGVPAQAQPAFTDISGAATTAQLPTITSGQVDGSISNATTGANSALTDGTTVTFAAASAFEASRTLLFTVHSGSRTLTTSGLVDGGFYVLYVTQDATGGEGLTLGSGCTWRVGNGGVGAITTSTTANTVDILTFIYRSSNTSCYANFQKNFS